MVVDFALNVSQQAETVTISAEAAQVETTSAAQTNLVDSKQIANLPLNGRNFDQLISLAPGVQLATTQAAGLYGKGNYYAISGGRPVGLAFRVLSRLRWLRRQQVLRIACAVMWFAVIRSGPARAVAQIVVSSNDNKEVLVNGVRSVVPNAPPDTATIIDLNVLPPRVIGEVNAPGSWSAPPQSVAISPDESIALIGNSTKIDPTNPTRTIPDGTLTIVDLKASPPAVIKTLAAGKRVAGVSINPAGTLAVVANRGEGTLSIFTIEGKTVTPAGKVDLGDVNCAPSLPVFTPDGKTVLVTRNNDNKISILTVNGTALNYSKRDISANLSPYGIVVTPKGDIAIAANIGNGPTGGADTLSVIDLAPNRERLIDTISVGLIPEGIALSPRGDYLAANVMNGSNLPKESQFFHDYGILKMFRVEGAKLSPLTEAKVGHWCEGVAWSRNQRTLLVQCMVEKEIFVLSFDGTTLKPSGRIKINGGPAGIRTAQQ